MRKRRKRRDKGKGAVPPSGFFDEVSLEQMCLERMHHTGDGRFVNPWSPMDARTLRNVIRWKMERTTYQHLPKGTPPPVTPVDTNRIFEGDLTVTFLGHTTLIIQVDGVALVTDPIFSNLSPYLKRKTKLPLPRKALKEIVQGALVSHNHFDHLSLRAARYLRGKTFITPLGFKRYFRSRKSIPPVCLDWYDSVIFKGLKITFLPAQHWSRRTLRDTNRTLWGGFLIEGKTGSVYFSGDSGYFPGFREIGKRFRIDVAILPIGAFAPRWLMKPVHMSPYEAVRAAMDLKTRTMIPCHWGTYQISDEPLSFPIQLLRRIKEERRPPLEILPLLPGETFIGQCQ